jgi:hypothetical protein
MPCSCFLPSRGTRSYETQNEGRFLAENIESTSREVLSKKHPSAQTVNEAANGYIQPIYILNSALGSFAFAQVVEYISENYQT